MLQLRVLLSNSTHTTKNPKRRRRTDEEKETMEDLNCINKPIPADLIAEILSRLPTKSIGRFMSVCKSWRRIITSRRFSSMHEKSKPFSTIYATWPIFDDEGDSRYTGHIVDVSEIGSVVVTTVRPRSVHEPGSKARVVGSCNGLLCLLERRDGFERIAILNPITNKRIVMALGYHGDWKLASDEDLGAHGFHIFGYSPDTNEYKVFKGLRMVRGGEFRNSYAIFTVGVDKRWRELSSCIFPDAGIPSLCNGSLHWLVADDKDPCHSHIVAFDVAQETTRRMSIPLLPLQRNLRLTVLCDRLCLFSTVSHQFGGEECVLQKMEDYGDDGSWSRTEVPWVGNTLRRCSMLGGYYESKLESKPLDCATKYGGIFFSCATRHRGYRTLRLYCPKEEICSGLPRVPYEESMMLFEFTPNFSSINKIIYGDKSKKKQRSLVSD